LGVFHLLSACQWQKLRQPCLPLGAYIIGRTGLAGLNGGNAPRLVKNRILLTFTEAISSLDDWVVELGWMGKYAGYDT
jgi:hypothetical protein